jgi:serine/threonine-protein kinase
LSDDADSRSHERVGTVLNDKWTLERLLGVGGMAAVYAARHRNGARAAIKVLHPDLSRHREVRERFLREGYASNRVDHPGAVKVMDDDVIASGPDAGTAYLVMELLDGESLQDRLERGPPVGEREFLAIAECVLDVLQVAHARGVIHRDLKPENLFLVHGEGEAVPARVKVLDFGLARLLDGQTITSYGLALGTPSFMSPEQAAGRLDEIDGRTDLFALAATGFRLRTGRRIHEGANPVELVAKMANFAAPRVEIFAPDVGSSFARVIDRALEFKREDRYANAGDMREDVQRAIAEMDAGLARTAIALPPSVALPRPAQPRPVPPPRSVPPPPLEPPWEPPSPEATIEVSERDLKPSRPVLEPSLPVLRTEPRKRRRRMLLPWIAVLVFGAIGTKLWLDSRAGTVAAPGTAESDAAAASASANPSPSATATAAESTSAMVAATATATTTATTTATATATTTATATATATATTTATATATAHATATATTAATLRPTTTAKPAHKTPPTKHSGKTTH